MREYWFIVLPFLVFCVDFGPDNGCTYVLVFTAAHLLQETAPLLYIYDKIILISQFHLLMKLAYGQFLPELSYRLAYPIYLDPYAQKTLNLESN